MDLPLSRLTRRLEQCGRLTFLVLSGAGACGARPPTLGRGIAIAGELVDVNPLVVLSY